MKKSIFAAALFMLAGLFVCVNIGAQESAVYRLVVIDRADCPGATAEIAVPLFVTSHGRTGYYIVFGRGAVNIPSGAVVLVNLSSRRLSTISEYLSDPSFQRYVSSSDVLDGIRFAVRSAQPDSTAFSPTHRVATNDGSNLRLRSRPSTSGGVLMSLRNGSSVQLLETGDSFTDSDGNRGNWMYVAAQDGSKGWCFGAYLRPLGR